MATSSHITRRAALSSFSMASLAACSPVPLMAAASNPDAELFRIEAEFDAARAACEPYSVAHDRAEAMYTAMEPTQPEKLPVTRALFEELRALDERGDYDHPTCVEYREIIRLNRERTEAWKSECARISAEVGLDAAERAYYERVDEVDRIAYVILGVPARSLAGVMVKLRVHEHRPFDESDLLESVTADIRVMAGEA